ncbi:hypothetical protein OUZ56_009119 [Daphnia magna]|uniref:Uncharacterized protein n=1 Tax=Daphnia magna TaxID=35525 RepID=A0ABR0AF19_9CRUS|nr:hypothetical protein OUZ56_009119 [Daphnia magna]
MERRKEKMATKEIALGCGWSQRRCEEKNRERFLFGANGEKDKRLQSNTLQLDSASSTRLTLRFDGRERTAWGWSVEAANGGKR